MREFDIIGFCNPSSDNERYALYWEVVLGYYIDNFFPIGAKGYVYSSSVDVQPLYSHMQFMGIDNAAGTIFGKKVQIFGKS